MLYTLLKVVGATVSSSVVDVVGRAHRRQFKFSSITVALHAFLFVALEEP
jgi:hypothetical protein